MGATLKLSPKHGLNPTVSVCFWCGEDKNEIALLGHIGGAFGEDIEAERRMVLDYEPCPRCKAQMESGFTVVEVTNAPNRVTHIGGAFGEDIEAERRMVLDYEPCPRCKAQMESGFTVVEVTNAPNRVTAIPIQIGAYPTGRFVVVRPTAARRVFGVSPDVRRALLEDAIFRKIF